MSFSLSTTLGSTTSLFVESNKKVFLIINSPSSMFRTKKTLYRYCESVRRLTFPRRKWEHWRRSGVPASNWIFSRSIAAISNCPNLETRATKQLLPVSVPIKPIQHRYTPQLLKYYGFLSKFIKDNGYIW